MKIPSRKNKKKDVPGVVTRKHLSQKYNNCMTDISLSHFILRNINWEYLKDESEIDDDNNLVRLFVSIPFHLEKPACLGVLLCLSIWLSYIVYIPIRVLYSCFRLIIYFSSFGFIKHKLHRPQLFDCLRFLMFLISLFVLSCLSLTRIYHTIRGQEIMKFFVIYNMLDVSNTLFSSLCQDALNTLYNICEYKPSKKKDLIYDTVLCTACIVIHTIIKFLLVITLSVTFDISFFILIKYLII